MDLDTQIRLAAFVDGELGAGDRREVAALVERDAEAAAIVNELKWARAALREGEPALQLPESREFFWGKVERAIQAAEPCAEAAGWSLRGSRWFKLLYPAAGLAAMLGVLIAVSGKKAAPIDDSESVLENPGVYTFHSKSEKMSVIWIYSDESKGFSAVDPEFQNEREAGK